MKEAVFGILAHVDSGKTTLSEALLFKNGQLRKIGRVDHGDAFLDTEDLEKNRGITIFSKQAILKLNNTNVTLLDTPGHVDFSAEMERTLSVLDYAILVISGADGVQSHTETLWKLLRKREIPTFIFVNKMDIVWKKRFQVVDEIKRTLGDGIVDFTTQNEEFYEEVALSDDDAMENFLRNGHISDDEIAQLVKSNKIFPCFLGSGLKLEGIDSLLEGMDRLTVAEKEIGSFGARVFKIGRDNQGNRLTHLKVTGGTLKIKDEISGMSSSTGNWTEKVNQIRIYSGSRYETVEEAHQGVVCAVTGLSHSVSGEGFGFEQGIRESSFQPVLTYKVMILDGKDPNRVLSRLKEIEEEDPTLRVNWNQSEQEINLNLMGEMQLEILQSIVKNRFDIDIAFDEGTISYRETIGNVVEGVGHFEPLHHYAEVHLLLEPGESGSGIVLDSSCSEDQLSRNWQRLIISHLEEKEHIGVLTGSPITDIKITLVSGRAHIKHTEGGDFRQATYRAVRQALMQAESILLEPWCKFNIAVPMENMGKAVSDIQRRYGKSLPPQIEDDMASISGEIPLATIGNYQQEIKGYTGGKGRITYSFTGYKPCHNCEEVIGTIGYEPIRDVENTADSVFCQRGSGVVIPWDKVYEHMHLESIFDAERRREIPEKAQRFARSLATDKELLAIFERTYGPVKRRLHSDTKKIRPASEGQKYVGKKTAVYNYKEPEYLLIDGYNVIYSWDELSELSDVDFGAARERLIDVLCNYQGFSGCRLIVVFDAYKVKGNTGSVEQRNNISVVYTKEAETADMYIEKVTHEIGRKHRVRVVTSDGLEQLIILGHGATRVSSRIFLKEVKEAELAIREYLE